MMSLIPFCALTVLVPFLSMEGQRALGFHPKYLNLCSKDEWRSFGFETTWGRVMTIFIFGWTIPFTLYGCLPWQWSHPCPAGTPQSWTCVKVQHVRNSGQKWRPSRWAWGERSSNSRPVKAMRLTSSSSEKMPMRLQMATAVPLLSPVIIMTRMPAWRQSLMEAATSVRGGSSMPTQPTNVRFDWQKGRRGTFRKKFSRCLYTVYNC